MKASNFLFVLTFALLIVAGCRKPLPVNEQMDISEFLANDIEVFQNVTGRVPLSALIAFRTARPVEVEWTVEGEYALHFSRDFGNEDVSIPVIGLYPDTTNTVRITLRDINGNWAETEVTIQTEPLPDYFPEIEITVKNEDLMAPGWHLCGWSYGTGSAFQSRPFLIDPAGNIRWYLEFVELDDLIFPIKVLPNGHLIFGKHEHIYEMDWLGRVVHHLQLTQYTQHHDLLVMPNGHLLLAVNKVSLGTVEDHIIEVDWSGAVFNVWDLRQVLDVDRYDLTKNPTDWFHMNAIWYSESDDCIVVSGRNQGVAKINRQNELVWILAPHQGWGKAGPNGNGIETSNYLLTALSKTGFPYPKQIQQGINGAPEFEWPWGQHAVMYLPSGNLFLFDNGYNRHFTGAQTFSRAVEYRIDEEDMTVTQIWQYGKGRGADIFSPIISDVDLLSNTNRLMNSGIIFGTDPRTTIMEVTYPDKALVWEAILHHKNLKSGGNLVWGDFDLTYRSERVDLESFEW